MSIDEFEKAIEALKKEGLSDRQIVNSFYKMYQNDKITFEQLETFLDILGLCLSDEFINLSEKERKEYDFEFKGKTGILIEKLIEKKNEENLNKIQIKEEIFSFFIANYINDSELIEILEYFKYKLPDDFINWPTPKKKRYYLTKQIFKDVHNKNEGLKWKRLFCHAYYYDLVEAARKSYKASKQLIEYVSLIDSNFPIIILTMQNIKIKNIWKYGSIIDLVAKYVDKINKIYTGYEIETMYDLYMMVSYYFPTHDYKSRIKEELEKILIEDFKIDLNDEIIQFCFDIEVLLAWLYIKTPYVNEKDCNHYRKIANTIKNKFGILENSHLKEIDYFVNHHNARYYLKKVDRHKLISSNKSYYLAYQKILKKYSNIDYSKYKYNGYFALLLCLYGGEDNG